MSDKITVLIVEDNETYAGAMNFWFKNEYNCHFAKTIDEATLLIKNGLTPEVAIVDWRVKKEDQSNLIERESHGRSESNDLIDFIRSETSGRCRTILMSSFDAKSSKYFLEGSNAWGYFYKASDLNSLKKVFDKGFLQDSEIGKPTIIIPYEEHTVKRERG